MFTRFIIVSHNTCLIFLILCDLHLGGFEGFSEAYPELCYSSSNHLSTVEPEPMVTGRRTPAYDRVR